MHDTVHAARISQPELIGRYRSACQALASVLGEVERRLEPGIETREIDDLVGALIAGYRIDSTFRGNGGYPSFVTASVNEEVINTLPGARRLRNGDLLKLQVGVHEAVGSAYQCWTYPIGRVSEADRALMQAARLALKNAVSKAVAGARVRSISHTIESTLRGAGFSPNRDYCGHAMGIRYREPPRIPCYVATARDIDEELFEGQILTVNVIAHAGQPSCHIKGDGWNVVADDGTRSVMYSHLVVVRDGCAEILLPARP